MNSIIPDMTAALKAEAIATPNGLAQWALDIIADAATMTNGRTLESIAVDAIVTVFHGEASDSFRAIAHPVYQSPLALRSAVLNSPCSVDALEAKMVRLHRANEHNGHDETDGMIRDLVKAAALKYPPLGLSYGYIGNCNLFGKFGYDDRSFRVFTRLNDAQTRSSVAFGDYAATQLGALLVDMEQNFDDWCQKQIMRLAMGETYDRAPQGKVA